MKILVTFLYFLISLSLVAQVNIISTNSSAEDVLFGNFNPSDYSATNVIDDHSAIIQGINTSVNSDSLKSYLVQMSAFSNRNTGSDTVSTTQGIGAARRWAYEKFESFSAMNDNRLIPSYLQFNRIICGMSEHRNIFAVLPGSDTSDHQVILIEAHFDSRCQTLCDINCEAHGMEDNGSGSALVLELARVMSQFTFKNTIVFVLTIGEEQGLFGADAFSKYAKDNDIPIEAVLNNDVIGGVICGETSSAPSCPGENTVDSTQVRLFSQGGFNSRNKQLSRFIKLQYQEELLSIINVPMAITIMSAEDRTGRGGDHIPFRQDGYAAMRFTSANEHGNAAVGPNYHDRQHTSDDILGVDTDSDQIIDSFFVDFNYLARNAVINGTAATVAAIGPKPCDFSIETFTGPGIIINITEETGYDKYRVGLRTLTNDWDSVYVITGTIDTIYPPSSNSYIVSAASVDSNNLESLFSREIYFTNNELTLPEVSESVTNFELMQNRPNPFDEATIIAVKTKGEFNYSSAFIVVRNILGEEIKRLPIKLDGFINEVLYTHGYGQIGSYSYTLEIDGESKSTKMMVFAN